MSGQSQDLLTLLGPVFRRKNTKTYTCSFGKHKHSKITSHSFFLFGSLIPPAHLQQLLQTSHQFKDVPISSLQFKRYVQKSLAKSFLGNWEASRASELRPPHLGQSLSYNYTFCKGLKTADRLPAVLHAQPTAALSAQSCAADGRPQKDAPEHWEQRNELCVTLEGGTASLEYAKHSMFT